MALPPTVRVKLSSEAAEAISLTPVVVQELAIRDLIEHVLGVAGKDEARLCEILLRGTLVSGGSRFRWAGWEADVPSLREILATFPDPDPALPFAAHRCVEVILRGGRQQVTIPRNAVSRRTGLASFLHRPTFWDRLMELAASAVPVYAGYSYRDRADRYLAGLTVEHAARLRAASDLIRYSTLRAQIQSVGFSQAELVVKR
ncbi:MAG TPA: hypothetical protein VKB88_04285 [Bryobacteraceae bacterium]|nr:hypothetical protein [Bryobacteraceae bacterium]